MPVLVSLFVSCSNDSDPVFAEGYEVINGAQIYYKVMGEGEPLLFVHGGPGLDHSYFLPQCEELSDDFRLVFYDQRLCGRSQAQVDTHTIAISAFVEDIEQLRRRLDLGRVHLLGHSWGGLLSIYYALRYPGSLRSLILSNSIPADSRLWREEEKALARRFTPADSLQRMAILQSDGFQEKRPEAFERLLKLSFAKQFYRPALADSLSLDLPADFLERSQRFQYMASELASYDLHPQLSSLEVPTLIIYGAHEPAASLSGPALEEVLPEAELVVLPECGHFPFVERPEAYFEAISQFISDIE